MPKLLCECADKGCRAHQGRACESQDEARNVLYRIDMDDSSGTYFCDACADDACESGLFTSER